MDTLHLLMQPQKELQPDLKTNNTQNHQKIELYGSPTTTDLKKTHSSSWSCRNGQRGGEVWKGCGSRNKRDTLEVSDPSPRPDRTAQGSSTGKTRFPVTSGCKNQWWFQRQKKLPSFHRLKGQHGLRMYTGQPTPGYTTRSAAGRAPGTDRSREK